MNAQNHSPSNASLYVVPIDRMIKFNLQIDGRSVRSIQDLRNCDFHIDDFLENLTNQLLEQWLYAQGLEDEAVALADVRSQYLQHNSPVLALTELAKILQLHLDEYHLNEIQFVIDTRKAQREKQRKQERQQYIVSTMRVKYAEATQGLDIPETSVPVATSAPVSSPAVASIPSSTPATPVASPAAAEADDDDAFGFAVEQGDEPEAVDPNAPPRWMEERPETVAWGPPQGENKRYVWWPEVVLDKQTNLIWQRRCDGKYRTWLDAQRYAREVTVAKMPWRLPDANELSALFTRDDFNDYRFRDKRRERRNPNDQRPWVDTHVFVGDDAHYWTSNNASGLRSLAWFVDFSKGAVLDSGTTFMKLVRCVC